MTRCPRCGSSVVEPCDEIVRVNSEETIHVTHRCANPAKPDCPCRVEPFRDEPGTWAPRMEMGVNWP